MPSNISKVIVFGATGVTGTHLIEILREKQPDWQIVAISRSGPQGKSRLHSLNLPNVTMVAGDIEDLERVQELTKDVDMVYCTVGFPRYERKYWSEHWPVVVDNLLKVTSTDRPLVFCDNLYAYGPGTSLSPSSTTVDPSLKSKPAIRALLRQKFQKRMDEAPRSIVVVGGADFFGPHVTETSFLGDPVFGNIVQKKKKAMAIGSADVIHDFCYAKDFSNALYIASVNPDKSFGKFWICPHTIHNKTLRMITADINALLPESDRVEGDQVIPVFAIKIMSLFMSFMKEMKEMLGFWTKDYTIDDSDFVKTFNVEATPYEEALKETLEFFQSQATAK